MHIVVTGSKGDNVYHVLSIMPVTWYSINNRIYYITSWQLVKGLVKGITRVRSFFSPYFPSPNFLCNLHSSLACFLPQVSYFQAGVYLDYV